ncbi:SixA phosphatase family protein [Thalassotalea sp. PS06]|uniref:SixA phosphatase family protein n=1 Tax=Thalassotalea sp. PS06 TaxID=2594005 RepID=UPI0011630B98|nr:histidine phosphatase family protein [Thalassotalea sp. PS06]QDP01858.1 phosphoglycerate mutase [Thalassotalea sp. PS06]
MKILHLVRHAKSSWENSGLDDIERPLNERGQGDCQLMAPVLMDIGCCFSNVYCSNASRAKQTLQRISEHQFEPGMERIISAEQLADTTLERDLYTFNWSEVLDFCQALPENLSEVTLVGHNPAFTELQNYLSIDQIEHLPTCAYVRLECAVNNWLDLTASCARTRYFITPKMLKQGREIRPFAVA